MFLPKGTMLGDRNMNWLPGRVYVPAMFFTGMSVSAINEGGAANDAYGVNWEGSHTGAPISKEINSLGINGILLDTAGDMVRTDFMLPYDFDISKPMYVRVHWCSGSADVADTIDWIVLFKALQPEVTALGNPATALNIPIAQDTTPAATAYTVNRSPWGKINGGVFTRVNEHVVWNVEMDAFAVGLAEDKFLLGLELAYTPRRMYGADRAVEALVPSALLGDHQYGKAY
ncbi:MAG: hypothetical protein CV089_02145 [Nitrospira sp. WS110]|nr:hypothetical protein [Nitrospira sp. WS110]